jgi:cell division protein FtsW (lipid II flippase)
MALGIMGIPVALAPDLVVALVLGAVAVAAAASAGARRREVAAFGMAGVLLAALAFARHAAVVGARPWGPPAWVEALRSAGLMGHGLRATFPEPQAHTEAILALIAHRAGLLGFIGVLSLLLATLVGLRSRSRLAAEPHGRVVATSVAVALFAQASAQLLLGDGMVLLGYGGSSMVVTLLLLGLASRARTAQLGDGAVAAGQ